MPRVPQISDQRIQQTALPGARVNVDAPNLQSGQPLRQLEQTAGKVGDVFQKIKMDEKRKADDAATTEFYTKLAGEKQRLFWDSKSGAITRKGKDSFGSLEEYGGQFDKFADDLEKNLANDDQRAMARKIRQKERLEFDGQLQRHMYGESKEFEDQTRKAGVEVARNEGVLNYHAPGKVQESLKLQESLIMQGASGKPPALVQMEIENVRTQTHASVIKRMLVNKQDLAAKDYFEQHKGAITDKDVVTHIEGALKEGYSRGESQRKATELMTKYGGDLRSALDAARKIKDPDIQELTVSQIKTRHSENEAVKKQGEDERYQNAFNFADQSGERPDPTTWAALKPTEKSAIDQWIKHKKEGTEPATAWDKYYELKTIASNKVTQDVFAKMNLMEVRNSMANTEFKELVEIQTSLRNKDGQADKMLDGFRTDQKLVADTLNQAGIDPSPKQGSKDAEKVALFNRAVDEQVIAWKKANGKTAIPNTELQKIVDKMMIEGVTKKGWFWDTKKRAFELSPGENFEDIVVPKADETAITNELRKRGKPVTREEIIRWYVRGKSGS